MKIQSWSRFPEATQHPHPLFWRHQPPFPTGSTDSFLPFGMGRSYGDVCLNNGATLLMTRGLNRLISFDPNTGIICAEAGLSMAELLEFAVPRGWFPPVTPGTKFVTLGGMIANDIHGKNHHHDGCLGHHLLSFKIWRSEEGLLSCSPQSHPELFKATIGGLGLTGLITEATLRLIPIQGPGIAVESTRFHDFDEFLELSEACEQHFRYSVSWLDTSQLKKRVCRGIFYRGNHSDLPPKRPGALALPMPFHAPSFALNTATLTLFNNVFFRKHPRNMVHQVQHYDPFFYPLDRLLDWNRLYGRRGPLQYQCVVPNREALEALFEQVGKFGQVSFLTVLKQFGSRPGIGPLSFPRQGFTLAMDFRVCEQVFKLCEALDDIVVACQGAVYPAKDCRMHAAHFKTFFPAWESWISHLDPQFSSSFFRRIFPEYAPKDPS